MPAVSQRKPVIEIRDLAKHYGPVRAVDGITIDVVAGEIYALLGLNGAGKTTAIRTLLGMITPTAGTVKLFGQPVSQSSHTIWSQVGYLVETPASYPELTVRQNLHITARLKRLSVQTAVEAIRRLGLNPYADRRARDLSLGNQQRLGLAKALLGTPGLLVLDEPANGLDPAGVAEVRQLLKNLAAGGATILLSSHILAEVARLATRIGIIHKGRMITEIAAADLSSHLTRRLEIVCRDQDGAAAALRKAGHRPHAAEGGMLTLAGDQAVGFPDQIATLLVNAGWPPVHLAVHQEDLETLFLRLTGHQATA
ncbi:MAG TPA: bacitracin ABC transporter ATP-binding protein [Micromonosporaceae bacterium]|nr:bacitracin ABC transporter ATP-binding protein [Micromonosporaceae bacterium]